MRNWLLYLNIGIPVIVKSFIPDGRYGVVTIITDLVLLPLVLLILNITIVLQKIETSFFRCSLFMLGGLLVGDLVGYVLWGLSSKHLLRPDAETSWIIVRLAFYHLCVVAGLLTIFQIGRMLSHFFQDKS